MHQSRTRVIRVGWFHCRADWSWESRGASQWPGHERPFHWNYDLWTVLEGTGTLKTPEGLFHLSCGDCFLLRSGDHYIGEHNPKDPLVVIAVHFDFLDFRGRLLEGVDRALHRRIEQMEFFTHLLERLHTAWHGPPRDEERANLWLTACLVEIERQDQQSARHGYQRRQAAFIDELCRDIRLHPERTYRVNALAGQLHCTRRHFSRLFKQITGQSPQDYIVEARIEAAKGLLHSSSYSIARIAELTGYKDTYFFSRQFKQKTGLSPSRYRR